MGLYYDTLENISILTGLPLTMYSSYKGEKLITQLLREFSKISRPMIKLKKYSSIIGKSTLNDKSLKPSSTSLSS